MTHPAADLLRAIADGKQMERFNRIARKWANCEPETALQLIAAHESQYVRIAFATEADAAEAHRALFGGGQ